MEGSDLPTTIREKLEGPNRTRLDLVDVVRGLGFAEDLGAPAIPEFVPEQSSDGQVVRSRISSRIRIHYVKHGTSDNTNKKLPLTSARCGEPLDCLTNCVSCQLLCQQPQKHPVPGLVARGITLALDNQPLVVGDVFAMDETLHTVLHGNPAA